MPFTSREKIDELNRANRGRLRIVENRLAYLPIDKTHDHPDKLLALVESIFSVSAEIAIG